MSEAQAEAMAVAPITRAMLYTVELWHPQLTAPVRIVADHAELVAALEQDAPVDGGDTVRFVALPIGIQLPEESDSAAAPSIEVWIDGVSSTVAGELDACVETLDPIRMIVRVYASDDLTGPAQLPPLVMDVVDVALDETRVTVAAAYSDPANRAFPAKTYSQAEYAGLAAR